MVTESLVSQMPLPMPEHQTWAACETLHKEARGRERVVHGLECFFCEQTDHPVYQVGIGILCICRECAAKALYALLGTYDVDVSPLESAICRSLAMKMGYWLEEKQ